MTGLILRLTLPAQFRTTNPKLRKTVPKKVLFSMQRPPRPYVSPSAAKRRKRSAGEREMVRCAE